MITIDPNKICYIFDVDGTLTEPRQRMDSDFANEFEVVPAKLAQKAQIDQAKLDQNAKIAQDRIQSQEDIAQLRANVNLTKANDVKNKV